MKKRILAGILAILLLAVSFGFARVPAALAEEPEDTQPPEATPTPEPPQLPDPPPFPEVTEDLPDIDIHSWEFRLCNAYNSVAFYEPEYGPIEGQGLDPRVVPYALALLNDAREQGYSIYLAQAFRNLDWLEYRYLHVLKYCEYDPVEAAKTFQSIGVNEHQTGLAVDFTDEIWNRANYELFDDPEMFDSALYSWLLEHCAEYGFVPRYPEGKEYWYGVACPHAHFRFVGPEAARFMMEHDLCLEEFLVLYDPNLVYVPEHGRFA